MPSGGTNKGKGKCVTWLREHIAFDGNECLIFPFNRGAYGYGQFGLDGELLYAHRWMCEQVHGSAPGLGYEAAHSCGNGHGGCVHPKHLSWKTKAENRRDSILHGTHHRNQRGRKGRLTPEHVLVIRQERGTRTQGSLAAEFNVSAPTIRAVQSGRIYKNVRI